MVETYLLQLWFRGRRSQPPAEPTSLARANLQHPCAEHIPQFLEHTVNLAQSLFNGSVPEKENFLPRVCP